MLRKGTMFVFMIALENVYSFNNSLEISFFIEVQKKMSMLELNTTSLYAKFSNHQIMSAPG